jgi:hypothetical protein
VDCRVFHLLEKSSRDAVAPAISDPRKLSKLIAAIEAVKYGFSGVESRVLRLLEGSFAMAPDDLKNAQRDRTARPDKYQEQVEGSRAQIIPVSIPVLHLATRKDTC